jgi:hypothetical protein
VGLASVITNLAVISWMGVRHGADTRRYVAGADDLLAGRSFRGAGGWLYIGYNALLAAARALATGDVGVIAIQVAAAAVAAVAVYELGRRLAGPAAGTLAAAFVIADVDIARWHAYVLTDSLYISLVAITTWLAERAVGGRPRAYVVAVAGALCAALIRPNGWVMLPVVVVYWIARAPLGTRTKYALAGGVALAAAAAVLVGRQVTFAWDPAAVAGNPELVPFSWILSFRNAWSPGRMLSRVVSNLLHTRPRYSTTHNAAVLVLIALTYALAVLGFVRTHAKALAALMAAVIVVHQVVVALTFADPDGRYLLYVFPLFLVLAAVGASSLRRKHDFGLSFRDA